MIWLVILSNALVLVGVSIAVKRYHDHIKSYKEDILISTSLRIKGLVHCGHGRKHGITQADVVVERLLGVLHLDLQAAGKGRQTDAEPDLRI